MLLAEKKAKVIAYVESQIVMYSEDVAKYYADWIADNKDCAEDIAFVSDQLTIYSRIHLFVDSQENDLPADLYHSLVAGIEAYISSDKPEEVEPLLGIIEYFQFHDDRAPMYTSYETLQPEWKESVRLLAKFYHEHADGCLRTVKSK